MISLVVGLGNPGTRYSATRHNLGQQVLSEVASRLDMTSNHHAEDFVSREVYLGADAAKLVWPQTFMNNSGAAVLAALEAFHKTPAQLLVICDDLNLPLGVLRLRSGGSHGGHNGLRSIIESLDTDSFPRLRIGIGPLPPDQQASVFVLNHFDLEEQETVQKTVATAAEAVIFALSHPLERVMARYNGNPASPEE